eukprot:CAMPEP_0172357366 /NCGR_PEP_ID=MMETSP1060-20121228/1765_1 /TAXON_ID=37318 /ORGANISM="Pseudo-nitzschia pungens, Strain cf. cingulata" /LENGTH=812 /DNA_ID=CAMNT_0013078037 /DNA_START=640 /DNA_END=3078 /DNA_ORIENTATION=-
MESAISYLQSLVADASDDNGKRETKQDEAEVPECSVDVTQITENPCTADMDIERQDMVPACNHHANRKGKKSKKKIKDARASASRIPAFVGLVKTKSLEMASRFSLFQSYSEITTPYNMEKAGSNVSKKTAPADEDDDDDNIQSDSDNFSWANALSSKSEDEQVDYWAEKTGTGPNHKPRRRQKQEQRHIEWWSHGIVWTCMALFFGWFGVGLSYWARRSTSFVYLHQPMYLDPRYETIPAVGMIKLELCWNETHLDLLDELPYDYQDEPDHKQRRTSTGELFEYEHKSAKPVNDATSENDKDEDRVLDCMVHRLTSDDIHDDTMYTVSQAVAFLSMVMGGFVTICLTASIFWRSINLRPIGAGYLLAYFLQSFTFLIFDSDLCSEHQGCTMSRGGILSAIASICWIVSCAASARMEKRKLKNEFYPPKEEQKKSRGSRHASRRASETLKSFQEGDDDEDDEFELMCRQQKQIWERTKSHDAGSPRAQPESDHDLQATGQQEEPTSHSRSPPSWIPKPKAIKKEDRAHTSETIVSTDDEYEPIHAKGPIDPSSRSVLSFPPHPSPPPEVSRRSRQRSKSRTRSRTRSRFASPERARSPQRRDAPAATAHQREDPSGKLATSPRNLERPDKSRSPRQGQERQLSRSRGRKSKPDLTVDVTATSEDPGPSSPPTSDSPRKNRRTASKSTKIPPSAPRNSNTDDDKHRNNSSTSPQGEIEPQPQPQPRRERKTVFDFASAFPDSGDDAEQPQPQPPADVITNSKPKSKRSPSRSRSRSRSTPRLANGGSDGKKRSRSHRRKGSRRGLDDGKQYEL